MITTERYVRALIARIRACELPVAQMAREAEVPRSTLRYLLEGSTTNPHFETVGKLERFIERYERGEIRPD